MKTSNKSIQRDTVGYLPRINAPATQLSTVHQVLLQIIKIKAELHLEEIVCVFDQALYVKAMEIKCKNSELFKKVVIHMGAFHTLCNLLSIIGKSFIYVCLRDLAVESVIIAKGLIISVLEGQHYNCGFHFCGLVSEALLRLAWAGFYFWLEEYLGGDVRHIRETMKAVATLHDDVCQDKLEFVLKIASVSVILTHFLQYLDELHNTSGQLASFWTSFLDLAGILLDLIGAS